MITKLIFLSLLFHPVKRQILPSDTTIKGIEIKFDYSLSIFPESWQPAPISAWGDAIAISEVERSKTVMVQALHKYPDIVLEKNLTTVYFLKNMKYYDVPYGGTNSTDAVYITNNGVGLGYSDNYLEQTFHHEFSSILFRNHSEFLDTSAWSKANLPGFDYNDPENGVGSIRNNKSSQDIDTILCQQGFLTQYALSSIENDINTIAQNLFSPSQGFWQTADKYSRISKKVKLLIDFYNKIDSIFTEAYFKNLRPA